MNIKKKKIVKPKTTITGIKEDWNKMIRDENDGKIIISSTPVQREFSSALTRLDTEVVLTIKSGVIQSIKIPDGISVVEHNYDTDGISRTDRPVKKDEFNRKFSQYRW